MEDIFRAGGRCLCHGAWVLGGRKVQPSRPQSMWQSRARLEALPVKYTHPDMLPGWCGGGVASALSARRGLACPDPRRVCQRGNLSTVTAPVEARDHYDRHGSRCGSGEGRACQGDDERGSAKILQAHMSALQPSLLVSNSRSKLCQVVPLRPHYSLHTKANMYKVRVRLGL